MHRGKSKQTYLLHIVSRHGTSLKEQGDMCVLSILHPAKDTTLKAFLAQGNIDMCAVACGTHNLHLHADKLGGQVKLWLYANACTHIVHVILGMLHVS